MKMIDVLNMMAEDEIIKEEVKMLKKYNTLDSAIGSLETKCGYMYIRAYLVEIK